MFTKSCFPLALAASLLAFSPPASVATLAEGSLNNMPDLPSIEHCQNPNASILERTDDSFYKNGRFEMYTITGEDLRTMSSDRITELKEVLIPKHGVVLLKNQTHLSKDDMMTITHRFGTPVNLPESLRFNNTYDAYPALARISNIKPDGTLIKSHKGAEYWHSDGDFWGPRRNYVFNFLYAEVVPPVGGETGLVDLRRAYHRLDEATKQEINDLEIVVKCSDIPDFKGASDTFMQPDAYHKIRHEHIVTGTVGLYIGSKDATIHGISHTESDRLMAKLYEAIADPSDQLIHQWEAGDMLIWDNTSTMHRSMGGYMDHPRVLYRTQAFMADDANPIPSV